MFFVIQFQTVNTSTTNWFFFLFLLFIHHHYCCCWNWKKNSVWMNQKWEMNLFKKESNNTNEAHNK
jgi:hypothetical protein